MNAFWGGGLWFFGRKIGMEMGMGRGRWDVMGWDEMGWDEMGWDE
jgi:hypothetical protein